MSSSKASLLGLLLFPELRRFLFKNLSFSETFEITLLKPYLTLSLGKGINATEAVPLLTSFIDDVLTEVLKY